MYPTQPGCAPRGPTPRRANRPHDPAAMGSVARGVMSTVRPSRTSEEPSPGQTGSALERLRLHLAPTVSLKPRPTPTAAPATRYSPSRQRFLPAPPPLHEPQNARMGASDGWPHHPSSQFAFLSPRLSFRTARTLRLYRYFTFRDETVRSWSCTAKTAPQIRNWCLPGAVRAQDTSFRASQSALADSLFTALFPAELLRQR